MHFHYAWIMRDTESSSLSINVSLTIVCVLAFMVSQMIVDSICYNMQKLQWRLEKVICEMVILQGSSSCHCKVLARNLVCTLYSCIV